MLRRVVVLVGFISIVASPAFAEDAPRTFSVILRAAADVAIPAEWDGVWQSTDSTYDCTSGTLKNTSSSKDTLCGGKPILATNQSSAPQLSCTGSATSTSIDVTCTGTAPVFAGCDAELTYHIVATRTGDHYDGQFTTSIHYVGSCSILTDSCNRTSSHADRIGPAPTDYCATPTQRTTWGRVKTIYR